jgi:hypothetical protein
MLIWRYTNRSMGTYTGLLVDIGVDTHVAEQLSSLLVCKARSGKKKGLALGCIVNDNGDVSVLIL